MKRRKKVKEVVPGSRATVYTLGGKIELILPVLTPEQIRRSLGLSKTAKLRVARAIRRAGLQRRAS